MTPSTSSARPAPSIQTSYCYLAGSLAGPPVTRVYADLDDILAGLDAYVGAGHITSGTAWFDTALAERLPAARILYWT